jgi:hypothetical protein
MFTMTPEWTQALAIRRRVKESTGARLTIEQLTELARKLGPTGQLTETQVDAAVAARPPSTPLTVAFTDDQFAKLLGAVAESAPAEPPSPALTAADLAAMPTDDFRRQAAGYWDRQLAGLDTVHGRRSPFWQPAPTDLGGGQ